MKTISNLGQEFGQYVIQLTAELMGAGAPKSLSEMERQIRQMLLKTQHMFLVMEYWMELQLLTLQHGVLPHLHIHGVMEVQQLL